ncbi:MAG: hypothetical protein VB858_03985 [Planctomycetaceae bacterium]
MLLPAVRQVWWVLLVLCACCVALGPGMGERLGAQEEPGASAVQAEQEAAAESAPGDPADTPEKADAATAGSDTDGAATSEDGEAGSEVAEEYAEPPPPPLKKPRISIQELKYRVEIPLVVEQSVHLGPAFRRALRAELQQLLDRSVGAIWDFQIYNPDWLTPRNSAGIQSVSGEDIKWRNRVFSAAEAIAELVSLQTEGQVTLSVPIPLPAQLFVPVSEIISIPDEVEYDEERKRLLTVLIDQMTDGQIAAVQTELLAELMTLYVLPTPRRIDKVFPIAVEKRGSFYHVTGREWDRESETLSRVRTRKTLDRRGVAEEILGLVAEVYHPVGQVDEANPNSARIKMRAGYFRAGNSAFTHATEETLLTPFFRYLDEDRVVKQLQVLPWSYLTVNSVRRERVESGFFSGVSTPLGAFRRRRMEIRAITLKPDLPETTLRLAPKRNHDRPLVGYLVAVYDEPPPPPPPRGEEVPDDAPTPPKPDVYRSDRFGRVQISIDHNKSLEWVYIRSGSALLTKFPFVPGAEKEILVECPDDTIRLDVEGQLVLLQNRLIDTIAKRQVVMSMIKNRRAKSEWKKVDESLEQLSGLPTLEEFQQQVDTIQFLPKERALARKDRLTVSRINRLGKQVLKVAEIHLDQEKLDEFREETREMRSLDQSGFKPRERRKVPGS